MTTPKGPCWNILVCEHLPELATRHNDDGSPIDAYHYVLHSQIGGTRARAESLARHTRNALDKPVLLVGPIADTLEEEVVTCAGCRKPIDQPEDEAVWLRPDITTADGYRDGNQPFHPECCPPEANHG